MTPWENGGGGGYLGFGGAGGGQGDMSAVNLGWSLLEKAASVFIPGVRYAVGTRDVLVGIQNDDYLGALQASLGLQSAIAHGGQNGLEGASQGEVLPPATENVGIPAGLYGAEELADRQKILEQWGKPGYCAWCSEGMYLKKYGDVVGTITSNAYKTPLLGPGGSYIAADDGWHMFTIDRYGNVWDNYGWHENVEAWLEKIREANPGGVHFGVSIDWKTAYEEIIAAFMNRTGGK